jgi:hypothetical protein
MPIIGNFLALEFNHSEWQALQDFDFFKFYIEIGCTWRFTGIGLNFIPLRAIPSHVSRFLTQVTLSVFFFFR